MHKALQPGCIITSSYRSSYIEAQHQAGNRKYVLSFEVLFVNSRRERSSGIPVEEGMASLLKKLGIRLDALDKGFLAIGCRKITYLTVPSHTPYPTAQQQQEADAYLSKLLDTRSLSYENLTLFSGGDFDELLKKKATNQDFLFTVKPPLEHYFANETISVS